MPWCPKCGAEYREGLTTCAKCQAALVEERPPAPRRLWRESLPPVVQRLLRKVAATGACAREALRLFRRHPSLLLVPALLAFADAGVRGASHFSYGRESSPRAGVTVTGPTWIPVTPSDWASEKLLTVSTIGEFARPIPTPSLTPVVGAWWATRYRPVPNDDALPLTRPLMAASMLVSLIDIALGAVILAGYYGMVCTLVSSGARPQRSFRAGVRRHWLRFLQVGVIIWALLAWLPLLQFFVSESQALSSAGSIWVRRVVPVAFFFLALPLYIVVLDGEFAITAIRRSVCTVGAHLGEMVALLVGFALARALVLYPLLLLSQRFDVNRVLAQGGDVPSRGALWGASLTSAFVANIWTSILGVWLCLTMFFWYRAVTPQPASATGPSPPE